MCDNCCDKRTPTKKQGKDVLKQSQPIPPSFWAKLSGFTFLRKNYFVYIFRHLKRQFGTNVFVKGLENGDLQVGVMIYEIIPHPNKKADRKYLDTFKFTENVGSEYVNQVYVSISNNNYDNILPNTRKLQALTIAQIRKLTSNQEINQKFATAEIISIIQDNSTACVFCAYCNYAGNCCCYN
jgi:hypothetical protein